MGGGGHDISLDGLISRCPRRSQLCHGGGKAASLRFASFFRGKLVLPKEETIVPREERDVLLRRRPRRQSLCR